MLNNIYFVALHVFDEHKVCFVISSQGRSVKFDVILILSIGSPLNLPLTLPGLNI